MRLPNSTYLYGFTEFLSIVGPTSWGSVEIFSFDARLLRSIASERDRGVAWRRTASHQSHTRRISMSRFDDLQAALTAAEGDLNKFYVKGNKAAGTRARKALQDLRNLAQEVRLEIQSKKNDG